MTNGYTTARRAFDDGDGAAASFLSVNRRCSVRTSITGMVSLAILRLRPLFVCSGRLHRLAQIAPYVIYSLYSTEDRRCVAHRVPAFESSRENVMCNRAPAGAGTWMNVGSGSGSVVTLSLNDHTSTFTHTNARLSHIQHGAVVDGVAAPESKSLSIETLSIATPSNRLGTLSIACGGSDA